MPSFNRVTLMGNLTRDPQVKHLPSNTTVADFGLAMSRRFKTAAGEDREEVCFIDCSAFGKQAEVIGQYCKKGKPLFVEGRLKFDQWDDRTSGVRRSKISVVVEHFQFVGGPGDGAEQRPTSAPSRQTTLEEVRAAATTTSPARKQNAVEAQEKERFTEADIPF